MCETIDEGNAIESGTRLCEDVSLCVLGFVKMGENRW